MLNAEDGDKRERKGIFEMVNIKHRKRNITLLVVLQGLVVLTTLAQLYHKNYYNVFLCVLTLALFNIPKFVGKKFNVELPSVLESIILLFIFAAEILGEIQNFYTIIPHWDTMLHVLNGFLMAAIGFAMIDVFNNDPRFHFNVSPYFVAFVAFCFSMTVGVIWEFFEFAVDLFLKLDMQKDSIITSCASVLLNPTGLNEPLKFADISKTIITYMENGMLKEFSVQGYLDIGLMDTMKDLIVNLIGATVFSVIGFFYIKNRGKGSIANNLIPKFRKSICDDETEK